MALAVVPHAGWWKDEASHSRVSTLAKRVRPLLARTAYKSAARARPSQPGPAGSERQELEAAAAAHGRSLHDVPGDNSCLFHALLHALRTQLQPPQGTDYDVGSLRRALLDVLEQTDLRPLGSRLGRQWRRGEVYMETSLCVCALCLSRLSVHESIRHHKIAIRLRLLMIYTPK